MIKKLRLCNYRSIESLEFTPSQICALVGENNAGKSNILKALKTVLGKDWLTVRDFTPDDVYRHDPTRDTVIELTFDPPLIYEGFAAEDPTPVPILRYTLTRYKRSTRSARKGDFRLLQECLSSTGEQIRVLQEAPKRGAQRKYKPLTGVPTDVKAQAPLIYIGSDRRLSEQLPTARYSLLRRLLDGVSEGLEEAVILDDKGDEHQLLTQFEELIQAALTVLKTNEFVQLESLVRDHALENLGYDPGTGHDRFALRFGLLTASEFMRAMRIIVDEHGIAIDALDMGDGAQNAIILAVFQAYEKIKKTGAIFVIEEPELHLHPHRCKYLYDTLRRVAQTNQLFYSTHSPHFVTVPWFDEVLLVYRSQAGATEVNEPHVIVTTQTREKLIKEFDPERNELFFARHVFIVEGDTEKLALPEYAKRLGIDLNRKGISIVEVGGKKNVEFFVRIVQALGLTCTVVFDEDASDFGSNEKEKESEYNRDLLARENERTRVVMLNGKYESEMRAFFGDEQYQIACETFPGVTKAVRARLIAMDERWAIPDFINMLLGGFGDFSDP